MLDITIKNIILNNLCYTQLVYGRINKKLNVNLSKDQIEEFILTLLKEIPENAITKTGKNYYVVSARHKLRVTINSNTYRIITVDRIH